MKEEFDYFQCSLCNCLQISDVPDDMSEFYPDNYYSYNELMYGGLKNSLMRWLINKRNRYYVLKRGLLGQILTRFIPHKILYSLSQLNITENTRILDVGCGNGKVLFHLKEIGIHNVMGVDPFIKNDIEHKNGVKIHKKDIHSVDGEWDVILFNHSFEHMAEPLKIIQCVFDLLASGGVCIISIPTVSSFAWKEYGVDWVQLDAPRHFFLHSDESIQYLADHVGLKLLMTLHNSDDFQFWGSEQYKMGIPLTDERSYFVDRKNVTFSRRQIKEFKKRAKELNANKKGDSCVYFLIKE